MELLSRPMKFFPLCGAVAALSVSSGSFGAIPEGGGTAESLAAAEQAFAHESVEKGMRTAFLNALSDDGVVFDPGPGGHNGKKVWQSKPASPAVLEWQPILAVVASSGDLGYTTGPWNYRKTPNERPAAFGEFVSVWRRENGNWKLLCDVGSDHPAPSAPPPELKLINLPHPSESRPAQLAEFQAIDREYAANRAMHLEAMADDAIRLYRPGKFPALGKSAAAEVLKADATAITFGESKAELSRNGDLGFLGGEYRADGAEAATGDYLRIWRKAERGGWRLLLDLLHPR